MGFQAIVNAKFSAFLRRFAPKGAILAVGAAVVASGCANTGINHATAAISSCLSDRVDIVEGADWDTAIVRDIRIVDGNYRPMVIQLERDKPYILKISNADPVNHNFWAPGLFKLGAALDSVQIGDKTPAKGCVNGVRIAARSTVTIRLVPVWEGRYEMNNGLLPVSPVGMADGVFHIIEPRVGMASK